MSRFLHLFILFCLNIIPFYGQTTTVSGNIKDEKKENLAGISVVLQSVDSAIIAYAFSDDAGNYKLSTNDKSAYFILSVSGLSIANQNKKIGNKTQIVNFIAKDEVIQIKEVIVKSKKIYYKNDTLNYLVSSFSNENDQVIGDVLKKLPGIVVAESGQITYQGKAINKFYIENMDMLNNRYGIATQNIPANDVATVQVLENHQPIKLLDTLQISDQAAINLKLKEKSKGVLSIMLGLGLGAKPLLWDSDLTALYFGKGMQNISTFKTNNSGNDLSKELRSFDSSVDLNVEKIMDVEAPTPPDIDKSRYYFNNSNAATINNLFKLKKDRSINFNLIYYNDYEKRHSNTDTKYNLSDTNVLTIKEGLTSYSNINRLETEFCYNENSDKRYLNNLFKIEGSWEQQSGEVQTDSLIKLQLYRPAFNAINRFYLIKVKDDKGIIFNSDIGFRTSPQNMTVTPGLYPDLLHQGNDYNMLTQQGRINTFKTNNKFTFLSALRIGRIKINPTTGINININHLNSELFPGNGDGSLPFEIADSLKNNINRQHYKAYAGTDIHYSIGKLKMNVELPLSYNYYKLINYLQVENNEELSRVNLMPSLKIQYKLSSRMAIDANSEVYNNISNVYEMYSGYILSGYNVLNHYDNRFNETKGNISSVDFVYKNIFSMFFLSVGAQYLNQHNSVVISQNFNGTLQTLSYIEMPNTSSNTTISADVSKAFDWKKLSVKINSGYSIYEAQQFSQNNLLNYKNKHIKLKGSVSMLPLSFLSLSYEGEWGQNQLLMADKSYTPIRFFKERFNTNIAVFKSLKLGAELEHYYNNAVDTNRNLLFADVNMGYSWKQINFSLGWTNILNTRNYVKSYYNGINQYNYVYSIRPTNVMLKVKMKIK